jgi:hypothetical protein
LDLNVFTAAEIDALIMVVNRNGQRNLGVFLSDDVFIQNLANLARGRQVFGRLDDSLVNILI